MKNKLPKYWVVKRDVNNPNWKKVVIYLNEKYGQNFGLYAWKYYGYDGSKNYNGMDCWDGLSWFKNNPTLLTIEEFIEAIELKEIKPGELVGTSDISKEDADYDYIDNDTYKNYYIGKTMSGEYVTETKDGSIALWKFISNKNEEKKERKLILTDSEYNKVLYLIKNK